MFVPLSIIPGHIPPARLRPAWRTGLGAALRIVPKALLILPLAFLSLTAALAAFAALFGLIYRSVNPPVTSLMLLRPIEYGYTIKPVHYLPLEDIPEPVQRLVVEAEDSSFYLHGGIDLDAVKSAWKADREAGYIKYGGSTITQQLVRSLFLTTRRSIARKYAETVMAIVFDRVVDKRRQLELYLNYVEWGRGVYGVDAGSLAAYGKPVGALSTDQIARLIAILPNPVRFRPATVGRDPEIAARYHRLLAAQ